jgi:Peptidase A4 family
MRIPRSLLAAGSAVVLAGGLAVTASATASLAATHRPAAHHAAHHLSAHYLAQARAALVKYLGSHPLPELAHPAQAHVKPGSGPAVASFNWSGYADAATNSIPAFSSVSAKWKTPTLSCTAQDSLTSEWVGLDGFNSSTVEQDGTLGWCFLGFATYYTWWEMFPAGTVTVGTTLMPGDVISASVSRSGTTYTLSVQDSTNPANSFTRFASCSVQCLDASAEWIAERPAFSTTGIAPLARYGTWKVTNAQETYHGATGGISAAPSYFPISMEDSTESYFLSTPGPLYAGGTAFTTTWHNSY